MGSPQVMLEVAEKLAGVSPRIAVFDRKRKIELALKLQQRWQRWELTNFDYLMQVCALMQLLEIYCKKQHLQSCSRHAFLAAQQIKNSERVSLTACSSVTCELHRRVAKLIWVFVLHACIYMVCCLLRSSIRSPGAHTMT